MIFHEEENVISPEDAAFLKQPGITDQRFGFYIATIKNTQNSFDAFIQKVETDEHTKATESTIGNEITAKYINEQGLGDGEFHYYFKHPQKEGLIIDIYFPNAKGVDNPTYQQILKTLQLTK